MKRLQELRKSKGITQKEIAKHLNVQQTTYSKYERGASKVDNETLQKICKYLNISADYLLGNIDVPLSLDDMSLVKDLENGKSDQDLINEYDLMIGDKAVSSEEMKILLKMMKNLLKD